jgi:hypothetical protein
VADFFDEGIQLTRKIVDKHEFGTLKEFKDHINANWKNIEGIVDLKRRVNEFAR